MGIDETHLDWETKDRGWEFGVYSLRHLKRGQLFSETQAPAPWKTSHVGHPVLLVTFEILGLKLCVNKYSHWGEMHGRTEEEEEEGEERIPEGTAVY